jgi:hypothetical protein
MRVMVLRMNMSAGSAGGEWRIVNHWITTPAKRDQTVTTIRGVPTPDDGIVTGGTTVPRRHPLQRKCEKTIEERGPSVGMMPWHLMLENTPVVAETEHLAFTNGALGVWASCGVYGLAPKNMAGEWIYWRIRNRTFIYTHCLLR